MACCHQTKISGMKIKMACEKFINVMFETQGAFVNIVIFVEISSFLLSFLHFLSNAVGIHRFNKPDNR